MIVEFLVVSPSTKHDAGSVSNLDIGFEHVSEPYSVSRKVEINS